MARRVPDSFMWERYKRLNPPDYDWPSILDLSSPCTDSLAKPHASLYVGSSLSPIPQDVEVVVNVAADCPMRKDVGARQHFHIGLSDPATPASIRPFVKAVRLTRNLIAHQRTVFLHCMCGMNRSVSVAAAATALMTGEGVIDVLIRMSKQRPEVYPDEAYIILGRWLNGELPHPDAL